MNNNIKRIYMCVKQFNMHSFMEVVCIHIIISIMQINGKTIEWKHLRDLYHKFHSMAVQSVGLSLVPKLKMEHIELTSFSRMRVDLAAQVSNCTNLC